MVRVGAQVETFPVSELVAEAAHSAGYSLENRPIALQIDCPPDIGTMSADWVSVLKVLSELLSNASKFTEKGVIRVEVRREKGADGEVIKFTVADTGCGIAGDWLEWIFEPFAIRKFYNNRNGVGLFIFHQICQLMGGVVGVTSEVGKGSTFTMTLPAATSPSRRSAGPP
jgi:signal transduction histidine kinase